MISSILRKLSVASILAVLAVPAVTAQAQTLKIGTNPGVLGDTLEVAAAEANKQGLDVRVVEITDWTTPNVALQAGDLDLNYFQHSAYLVGPAERADPHRSWLSGRLAVARTPG